MGSPESEDDGNRNNNIDPAVGGLVWVRRRNGTWWPGRILGLDEISEGCLVSPRSGTPVKLLGREDASVDWYNLEKSKRVKAFRCGEYDECIAKAKASAASSGKKAVKYARREDAILHALELESARLGKDHPDYWVRPDNSGGDQGSLTGESPVMSHSSKENEDMTDQTSDSEDSSDSAPELSQYGISFQEPNLINGSKELSVQGKRRRTPNDSEDDGMEGTKRMRGLEDLGMGVGSKRKVQAGGAPELIQQESASLCNSQNGNVSNGGPVSGSKGCSSTLKRKRTPVANVHEFLKRKNRRRPLTKVLESTAMVSVPVICDQLATSNGSSLPGLSDSKASVVESNESRKSTSVVINNSESTGVSYDNGVSLNASGPACDGSHSNQKMKETEISSIPGLAGKDRLFDVPFVGEDKHGTGISPIIVPSSPGKPQVGVSGRQPSQCSEVEAVTLRNEGLNESGSPCSMAVHANNISQRMEKGTSKWQSKGKRKSRHMSKNRKQASRKYSDMNDEPNTFVDSLHRLDGLSHGSFDHKVDCDSICGSKLKSETEEQPWGKSLPHMRTTEVKLLSDESLNPKRSLPFRQTRYTVHSRYQDFPVRNLCVDSVLYNVELEVKAGYRRQHVPLVSLMSKLNGKAIIGHPLMVEVLGDGYCDGMESDATRVFVVESAPMGYPVKQKSEAGRNSNKRKKLSSRYSSSKSLKSRKPESLSKKIRKLSSLTSQVERKPAEQKPKGPVISCIPLKLVFSRINEAVNGSARPANRALT
ncbi:PWWP domain-containing protein [Citrus sinensis]|nr:PWWP domain-containing protein [Citrus sinensis]